MKKKNAIYLGLLFTIIFFTITSCNNDNDPANNVCDETYVSTVMDNAFSTANGYVNVPETMDMDIHQYRMKINADGEICSVGYQNPSAWTGDYTIEIINETSGASYSGVHSFSQAQLDYQSISPAVAVSSGDIILVKRTALNWTMMEEIIGRVFMKSDYTDVPYPITQGNIEFLSSKFYGTSGGSISNRLQPYIPLGFKAN